MLLSVSVTGNRERPVRDQDAHDPATAIEALFGGQWGVWRSDTGWWWAARRHALTADDLAAGCVPYLQAHSPEDLTEQIRRQPPRKETRT
jgi:hypothetical protein